MSTIKQLNKQNPQQYVMVWRTEYAPVFIAPLHNLQIQITDKASEATLWTYADTLSAGKLKMHQTQTGYTTLHYELIVQVEAAYTAFSPTETMITLKSGREVLIDNTEFKGHIRKGKKLFVELTEYVIKLKSI